MFSFVEDRLVNDLLRDHVVQGESIVSSTGVSVFYLRRNIRRFFYYLRSPSFRWNASRFTSRANPCRSRGHGQPEISVGRALWVSSLDFSSALVNMNGSSQQWRPQQQNTFLFLLLLAAYNTTAVLCPPKSQQELDWTPRTGLGWVDGDADNHYGCWFMQWKWAVCTDATDRNHIAVMAGCPITCRLARGECRKPRCPSKSAAEVALRLCSVAKSSGKNNFFRLRCFQGEGGWGGGGGWGRGGWWMCGVAVEREAGV